MKEFSRFENQYILMLAVRTKQELQKSMENQPDPIDPNVKKYIEVLASIAEKASYNMKEIDEKEKNKK